MPKNSTKSTLPITAQDIFDAAERIEGGIVHTPQLYCEPLSNEIGVDIYLKYEIFQKTSSFKDRGALNKLLTLSDGERKRGVVAMSAGNHAQGVAYHASRLGIPATIVMPIGTPFSKVQRTEKHGAEIVLAGSNFSEAGAEARRIEAEQNRVFIHPFDDPLIMAGQGTAGLEFIRAFDELDAVIVPIGGGGLISGVATAVKAIKPDIEVYGVQSQVYPSMKEALLGNAIAPKHQTIAEGIAVKEPGKLTIEVVKELVDDIYIVSENEIEKSINLLFERAKVAVEGAGAAVLAALIQNKARFAGKKVGLILAGGNIDARILASSLVRGLISDGRMSRMKVTMPDSPGSLAALTKIVAGEGGNVMEVYHQRQFAAIPLKYTTIELVVETKDSHHRDRIISKLESEGFEVDRSNTI